MKVFTSTNDFSVMPHAVRAHVERACDGERGMFDTLLGGDVFLLETLPDLGEIIVDYEAGGTALDTVAPMEDARLIYDHAVFYNSTTESGGALYFTPKWMVDHCPILQGIITATAAGQY